MPNDIAKLRRVMKAVNYFRQNNPVVLRGLPITPSQALKHAWWFEHFRAQLRTGVFRFSYFKTDSSIREAVGTLDFSRIPDEHHPKSLSGAPDVRPENIFTYYDLTVGDWRSFRLDNFVGFVQSWTIDQSTSRPVDPERLPDGTGRVASA